MHRVSCTMGLINEYKNIIIKQEDLTAKQKAMEGNYGQNDFTQGGK